jgi:hypothetical protein
MVNGEQYLAVLVGFGGALGLTAGEAVLGAFPKANKPRLLAFKIDGKDSLPSLTEEAPTVASAPPPMIGDAQTIAKGSGDYHLYCGMCHGVGAISGGLLPDLRHSVMVGDSNAFNSVVREGALKERGMASFGKVLSVNQTEAIRAYVIDRAHKPIPEDPK